jgi:ribosomal protein L40E
MSHLKCEKCGSYYKLKEGESPEDFKSCQCGGKLSYVQNFDSHFDEEMDPLNEINICPSCGTKNPASKRYCKSCKRIIKDEKNQSNSSKEKTAKELRSKIIIRILAIIAGILIVLIPQLLLFNQNYALILLVIGGLAASLIAGKNDGERALNGIIVGLIAGLMLLIFRSNITFSSEISIFNIFIFEMIGPLLILTLFGLLGGLIDILIRYLFSKI